MVLGRLKMVGSVSCWTLFGHQATWTTRWVIPVTPRPFGSLSGKWGCAHCPLYGSRRVCQRLEVEDFSHELGSSAGGQVKALSYWDLGTAEWGKGKEVGCVREEKAQPAVMAG